MEEEKESGTSMKSFDPIINNIYATPLYDEYI